MSDTLLKIIPTEPSYVPDGLSESRGKVYLEKFFGANHVEFIQTQDVAFIDPGQNFEKIFCDICDSEIDSEYWGEKVDSASLNKFGDLTFLSPCCGNRTSLNSLRYEWPAGFARFSIQITNPKVELSNQNIQELKVILNTPLRILQAHY